MITTDETATGTRRRPKRGPLYGRMTRYFCGCTVNSRSWTEHWCEVKKAALAPRKCAYEKCPVVFTPVRAGQVYHGKTCTKKAFPSEARKLGKDRKLRLTKGLTPEQILALEVAPIAMRHAAVVREAGAYLPLMGEALVEATLRLMCAE